MIYPTKSIKEHDYYKDIEKYIDELLIENNWNATVEEMIQIVREDKFCRISDRNIINSILIDKSINIVKEKMKLD